MESGTSECHTDRLARTYLQGVRGAIPLAQEQIQVLLAIVRAWLTEVRAMLDLSCGDGILGRAIQQEHPKAHAWFVDFSPPMLRAARAAHPDPERASFVQADLAQPAWHEQLALPGPVDLVVSGFAIHHLPHERKQALYAEVHRMLAPGGVFLNLEHVASPPKAVEALFAAHFVDHLYAYHRLHGSEQARDEVARAYYARQDKEENILAPVDQQCRWLRQIGYQNVDCFLKVFELALFGGRRAS